MHVFSKENIWSNPHASSIHPVIQTSTIILWTELFPKKRREKIQGENFNLSSSTVVFPQIIQELQDFFEYSVFYSVSTCNPATPSNSAYRINSSTRNTTTTRLIRCHPMQISTRHLPATVSCVSKHSTRQNKVPGLPTAFQGHTAHAGFQLILPGRNSILSGSQHPHNPYSSSQVHSHRIIPGEIGFIPKGLSIVCPCNTKVSVFQFTYSCA